MYHAQHSSNRTPHLFAQILDFHGINWHLWVSSAVSLLYPQIWADVAQYQCPLFSHHETIIASSYTPSFTSSPPATLQVYPTHLPKSSPYCYHITPIVEIETANGSKKTLERTTWSIGNLLTFLNQAFQQTTHETNARLSRLRPSDDQKYRIVLQKTKKDMTRGKSYPKQLIRSADHILASHPTPLPRKATTLLGTPCTQAQYLPRCPSPTRSVHPIQKSGSWNSPPSMDAARYPRTLRFCTNVVCQEA